VAKAIAIVPIDTSADRPERRRLISASEKA
jgi:hypothetical protein